MLLELLAPIMAALAGLYWGLWKNHGCIKRIESKIDNVVNLEAIRDEMIEIKDSVRMLKDG